MGDPIPFLFSTENSQVLELRLLTGGAPLASSVFTESRSLCSTIIISPGGQIEPWPSCPPSLSELAVDEDSVSGSVSSRFLYVPLTESSSAWLGGNT